MVEIIPAILAASEEEFRTKVEKVRALGLSLHIDVMDGAFVPNVTWAPVDRMKEILGEISFDAHLMVANPEHAVPVWVAAGARHIIFHAESTTHESMICRATDARCVDIGIALNPDTPISRISAEAHELHRVMTLGVTPGRSGQPFQDITIEKIRAIKSLNAALHVSVDGGVKPENARALADAGADALVVGSALTDQADPQMALLKFREALAE